jgi:hypothetical protein
MESIKENRRLLIASMSDEDVFTASWFTLQLTRNRTKFNMASLISHTEQLTYAVTHYRNVDQSSDCDNVLNALSRVMASVAMLIQHHDEYHQKFDIYSNYCEMMNKIVLAWHEADNEMEAS